MTRRSLPLALVTVLAATAAWAPAASAAPVAVSSSTGLAYRPGKVVVRYARGVDRERRAAIQRAAGVRGPDVFAPRARELTVAAGAGVEATAAALRRVPGVESAEPSWVARASGYIPADPGRLDAPGGWQEIQWNFLPGVGVDAPGAWQNLIDVRKPGGRGTVVAVLDTGVAYADRGRFRRSPDLLGPRFVKGYDFVDDDPYPEDHNGHGTHVASTIAESTGNNVGVTGLAYGARVMPVRVLDSTGTGDVPDIAEGIRYAVRRGADVINLSFEFGNTMRARQIPEVLDALRYARKRGVLVVGASGNSSARSVSYPARSSNVLSVGATTEHLCRADYANVGSGLDISAPGGGPDATVPGDPNCRPEETPGRNIFQVTFAGGSVRTFGLPGGFEGTSMAAPHVAGTAALVIASGVIGRHPSPAAIQQRLQATAVDLGPPGYDTRYGAGLLNAAAATARVAPVRH